MPTRKVIWSPTDVVALLAWLDFCLENHLDFQRTIIAHLRKTRKESTGIEFPFTDKQMQNKLTGLGRRNSGGSLLGWKTVQEQGSRCLHNLPPGIQQLVESTLNRYRLRNVHNRQPREDGFRHTNTYDHPHFPVSSGGADQSVGQRQTRDAINNSTEEYGMCERESTNGRNNRQTHSYQDFSTTPRDPTQADHYRNFQPSLNSIVPRPPMLDMPRQCDSESSQSRVPDSDVEIAQPMPSNAIRSHVLLSSQVHHPGTKALEHFYKATISKKDAEIKRLQEAWQAEVGDLYLREAQMKEHIKTLDATVHHLKSAQKDMSSNRGELVTKLFSKNQEISALTQLNLDLQSHAKFFKQIPIQRRSLTLGSLNEAMGDIYADVESILHGHDFRTGLLTPRVSSDSDLGALIRSSLQRPGEAREEVLLKDCVKRFEVDPEVVIRTLVLTALRDWVFETDYPSLIPTHFALLEAYRALAFIFGQWTGLYNYDLAAYRIVLDERSPFSQHLLPKSAKIFASRLSKALAPLFVECPRRNADFDTWGQEHQVSENRRFCLNGLFEKALKFKAQSVTTDDQYRFLVYPPGTTDSETASGFWLHASIHTYKADQSYLPDDDLANALVQTMNFLTRDIPERKDLQRYTKPMIIRKKEGFMEVPDSGRAWFTGNNNNNNSSSRETRISFPNSSNPETSSILTDLDQVNSVSQSRSLYTSGQATSSASTANEPETLRPHHQPDPQNGSSDLMLREEESSLSGTIASDDGADEDSLFQPQGDRTISATLYRDSRSTNSTVPQQQFQCENCGRRLASLYSLQRHERKNACKKCRDCGRIFAPLSTLESHRRAEHSSIFKTVAGHEDHTTLRTAASKNVRSLPSIGKMPISEKESSPIRIALDQHICSTCGRKFKGARGLKNHIRDGLCSKCFICDRMFPRKLDLTNHQKVAHINRPQEDHSKTRTTHPTATVVGINISFDQGVKLKKRPSLSTKTGAGDYLCGSCNQDFGCLLDLEDHHQRTHNTGKSHKRRKINHQENPHARQNHTNQDPEDPPSSANDFSDSRKMTRDTAGLEPPNPDNSIVMPQISSNSSVAHAPEITMLGAGSKTIATDNAIEDALSHEQELKVARLPRKLAASRQLEIVEALGTPHIDAQEEVMKPPASGQPRQLSSTLSVVIPALARQLSRL